MNFKEAEIEAPKCPVEIIKADGTPAIIIL